jgi:parallel beta-helix repeat protein
LNNGIFSNGGSNILIKGNKFDQTRTAVNVDNMSPGVTIEGNIFENNGTALAFGGTTPTAGANTVSGNSFKVFGTIANLSNVTTAFRLDLTGNTFDGKATSALSLAESFNIERTLFHRGRSSRNGAVTFVPNTQFVVTQNPSIQNAVTYSEAGGIVQVDSGAFAVTSMTLDKAINIKGYNAGIPAANGTGDIPEGRLDETVLTVSGEINVHASNITLDGLHLKRSERVLRNQGVAASDVVIQNCIVENTSAGNEMFQFFGDAARTGWAIKNSRFIGTYNNGTIQFAGTGWSNLLIEGNDFLGTGNRALFGSPSTTTIKGNFFAASNASAINMNGLSNPVIENNTVNVNGFGFQVATSDGGVIRNNTFNGVTAFVFSGDNYMRGIDIFGTAFSGPNSAGLLIENNQFNNFTADTVSATDQYRGVHMRQGAQDVTLNGNVFTNTHTALGIVATTPAVNGILFNSNDLSDVVIGINNGSTESVDATCNWWGDAEGPAAGQISGSVDASSWLITSDLETPNCFGGLPVIVKDGTTLEIKSGHTTIQAGVNAAAAGDIVEVAAGTYTENVNVNKRVILVGAGIDQTIVTAATGSVPTITVSASGSSVEDRLVIRDMKVTGATGLINPGSGILVQSVSAQSNLTIESVDASSNGGPGIAFNGTPSISDVVIKKSNLSNNANAGIRIASAVSSFNGLLVDSCTINNNASIAFSYNPDGNVSNTGTNFTISNTTFNNNSTAGVTNAHDLSFFAFRGNATLSNVTVTSGNGSTQNSNSYGISIDGGSGNGPLGTVSLENVTVQGHVGKGALLFQRYTEISGVSMNNVDLSNCVAPWGQLILSHTDADAFQVGNTSLKSLAVWTTGGANATSAQFKHITTGAALDRSTLADCFQIENQIAHKIDVATLGFARVKTGEVFVTPTSFAAPTTTAPSIQRGVDAAASADIVQVAAGSYTENVSISKSISLLGPNAGVAGYDSSRVAEAQILNGRITISGTHTVVVDGMQIYTTTNSPVDLILVNSTTSTATIINNRIERFGTTGGVIARGVVTALGITTPVVIENNFFTGDPSGSLFSGHLTLNNGIFCNGGSNILIKGNKFDIVRTALNVDNMSAGVTITENIFESNGTALAFGGTTATSGSYNLVGNSFKVFGTIANLSNVTTAFRLRLVSNTFDGKATASLDLEESFNIERSLFHRGRSSRNGAVTFVPNTQFVVTQNPSIQNAVTYSEAGGVVQVEAGTFTENVTINKALDVRGANYGINPNTETRSSESVLSGTFSLQSSGINVDGFEVIGAGAAFAAGGAGPWSNVTISNNRMIGKTGQQTVAYGFSLGNVTTSIGATNWQVSNNRIEDIQATDATAMALFNITGLNISNNTILHTNSAFNGRRGLNIDGCQNVVIANNNVDMGLLSPLSDNSDGAFTKARYPLQLSASAAGRAVSNITVSNNTMGGAYDGIITLGNGTYDSIAITGNEISNNVIGVRFQAGTNTPTGSQSNISILNNSISTSNRPIYLQNGTASSGTADAYNNVTISNNSLLRSSVGAVLEVQAGSILPGGSIAATCNWFGSASEVASKVVGDAAFTPYLISGADSDAGTAGFQPEAGACIGTGITATSSSTDALCFGESGSIAITISGGIAPFSINWVADSVSVSDTSYTISGLAAGVYDISITDSLGSVISLTDTIIQPDSLSIEGTITNQIACNGGTATVEVSAAGGVAPYTGTGEFTVSAGTYTYTVTDANGCSSDVEIIVEEPLALEISSAVVTTEIECFGDAGIVSIVAQGGTSPYTYTFNGESNETGIFEGVLAGTDLEYSVTDANSCGPVTGTISVTEPALITGSASDDICSSELPYAIFDTELSEAGVYSFTLTAENGCDSLVSFTLTVRPTSSSTTNLFICESAYPFTWNNETFTEPGTYLVTITNAAGCDSLATLNLSTFPGGPAAPTNPIADGRCNRGPVSLSVTPPAGATVDWFTASTGGSLLALGSPTLSLADLVQTTTFYARSRNTTTGCISTERLAVTASVTVVPVPDGVNASRCDEGTLVLTAIPNQTFASQRIEWYDQAIGGNLVGTGTTFETPVLSATTSYFAQAIDTIGGCTSISRKEVIARVSSSPETPTSSNNFQRCDPGTLTLSASTATGNATIFWYADSVGGTPLRTFSNTFVTPALSETTVYYAEAISLDLACASPRIPVTAAIASFPEDAVTVDVSRCGPGVLELSIEAPAGITADWYTASRGGTLLAEGTLSYTTPELSSTTAYFVATRNSETGCTSINRTRLNAVINAVPAVISTVEGQVCGEGTVNLRASTGVGATIDWFADEAGTELLVDGGTLRTVTLTTPVISTTTTFYAKARNTTTGCVSEPVTVIALQYDRPTVVESFPGSRCGAGSVELSATASTGATITWHISAITNSAIATGTTFNTPALSASRVYFAQARDTVTGCTSSARTEVLATINPVAATPVAPAVTSSCGSQTVTLTVSVAPGHQISWYESAVGGSPIAQNTASLEIEFEKDTYYAESISESTGCVSARVPVTITFTNAPPAPVGTDGSVCVSGRVSLSAAALPSDVVRWYSVATGGSILATGDTYLTPSLTETTVFYAESFNTSTGCVSTSRTAVNAVVNANPAPFETATFESCGPGEVVLALTAEQGITADWYTRFSGGILLAEGTLSYTTPALTATTLYYAAARDSATGCISSRVAVRALINALPLITGTVPGSVCGEGSASLRASAGAGATIDWFADEACTELLVDGGILRTVSLTTPSITATTTYYARARNTTTGCVSAPIAVTATVNDRPAITESIPGSRCGAGSVELSATASENAVITWHISAVTTSILATGTTYNTPSIPSSRVYFAQARNTITGCISPPERKSQQL